MLVSATFLISWFQKIEIRAVHKTIVEENGKQQQLTCLMIQRKKSVVYSLTDFAEATVHELLPASPPVTPLPGHRLTCYNMYNEVETVMNSW